MTAAVPAAPDPRRYLRQMMLSEVGREGQGRLSAARVLLVGAGGLGSPAALYLAGAGVGTLGLVDDDPVDLSNLHRQILHAVPEIGRPKVESASRRLADLNPAVDVRAFETRFTEGNAGGLLDGWDVVLDGSDNFETRYAVNRACVAHGTTLVWGAVLRWAGQAMTVLPGRSACYRCLFPEPPEDAETCAQAGVAGPVAGAVGCLMAVEALKAVLGRGDLLAGRLILLDFLSMKWRERPAVRRAGCPDCGLTKTL